MNYTDECAVAERFLDNPNEDSFSNVFRVFTPQLVAFFRKRGHQLCLAEDLAQEVMLTVYRKAGQLRERSLFRAWLFQIARHKVCRHFARTSRELPTVGLTEVGEQPAAACQGGTRPGFEFRHWMALLEPRERDVMNLRFLEELEYHEIAAAQALPVGTVQWRVYNSKRKLAGHLRKAA